MYLIFEIISVIDGWGISCELALRWMSLDLTDDKSTLVQVIAWCRQATSHYLSQWWLRSLSSYGVTRHQWVKRVAIRMDGILSVNTEFFYISKKPWVFLTSNINTIHLLRWCQSQYPIFPAHKHFNLLKILPMQFKDLKRIPQTKRLWLQVMANVFQRTGTF